MSARLLDCFEAENFLCALLHEEEMALTRSRWQGAVRFLKLGRASLAHDPAVLAQEILQERALCPPVS